MAPGVRAHGERAHRSSGAAKGEMVSALERGIALLRAFSEDQRVLSATELARLSGIPRPTVARLAATLVAAGLLKQEPEGERFMLGPGVVALSRVFLAGLDVRALARPPLQALAEQFGASVYLALRDGLEMVIIESCRARSSMLSSRLDVGSRVPLANAALGRAYLAAIDTDEAGQLVDSLRLARGTDWAALEGGLARALGEARSSGYCLSLGEFHREINSVSVALAGPGGEMYALNCGGSAFSFDEARLRGEIAPRLIATALQIAQSIGGTVPNLPVLPST